MRGNTKNEVSVMVEEVLVQMLLEAGGGEVLDGQDLDLARAAAAWAVQDAGWQLHLNNSFFVEVQALSFWILLVRATQTLDIRVRLSDQPGWQTHSRHHVAHLGHALEVLVAEGMLPARFAPAGRRALEDYATALDRASARLHQLADQAADPDAVRYGRHQPQEMRIRAGALAEAAEQARGFLRPDLTAVT